MKLNCLLIRDVLLHHGDKSVRVTQDIEVVIDFPDGTEVSRGVWQDKETRGEWRIVRANK